MGKYYDQEETGAQAKHRLNIVIEFFKRENLHEDLRDRKSNASEKDTMNLTSLSP